MGSQSVLHKYTVGFLFTDDRQQLALIRKNKPAWQRGMFNGIGGKIEPGENPVKAMNREFREETGVVEYVQWKPFTVMTGSDFVIHFFKAFVPKKIFNELKSPTDEEVVVVSTEHVCSQESHVIPNLRWLVPMALDNVMSSVLTL